MDDRNGSALYRNIEPELVVPRQLISLKFEFNHRFLLKLKVNKIFQRNFLK